MQNENSKTLVSISFVSNRTQEVRGMFDSIDAKTTNPTKVEIIIGIDDHDKVMREFLDEEIKKRKFKIKYLISPYEGFEALWKVFNKMHEICDEDAYFVQHSNDEMRFLTQGWDEKLEKYVGLFADDIFRLRPSMFKLFNYFDFKQALQFPDNFPIHTKKWIDITGWCDCHSADLYQQMIALYLSRGYPEMRDLTTMIHRDVPIFDIEIGGLEAGAGESEEEGKIRLDRAFRLWTIAMSQPIQELMQHQANLLRAHILTYKKEVAIMDKKDSKLVEVYEMTKGQYGNLLYKFGTYKRKTFYDIGVYDAMREEVFTPQAQSSGIIEVRKPRWLKKYKLHIFWFFVKYFMIFRIAIKLSRKE